MNKKFTVLVGLLVAVVVTSYSVCGTYAKYTEEFNGTSSNASIAKWAVSLDGQQANSNDFTFDLMDNSSNNSLSDGASTKLLAPGSTGSFKIKVINQGDVNANVAVTFSLDPSSAAIPLTFSNSETGTYGDINSVNIPDTANNTVAGVTTANANGGEKEITVYWKWDFDANTTNATGKDDTTLGKEAGKVIVKANVTVSQVAAA